MASNADPYGVLVRYLRKDLDEARKKTRDLIDKQIELDDELIAKRAILDDLNSSCDEAMAFNKKIRKGLSQDKSSNDTILDDMIRLHTLEQQLAKLRTVEPEDEL